MSLNRFMHPRNIYRNPPDFKQLAIQYPEFRYFAKQDLSGKIKIDFKNPEALRTLTKTLLLRDFDLDVNIPEKTLIPTLPLRLNYILWIEDLLANLTTTTIEGVDIGTGSSCIYPLLAAKKGWHMTGTEIDKSSVDWALKNVHRNSLDSQISIIFVENTDNILVGVLPADKNYDFCMCNPPFFADLIELDCKSKSRKEDRTEPKNAETGTISERITPGGEEEFIKKLIHESKILCTNIKIFTTMIGKKSSLRILEEELKKVNPVSVSTTVFCQGHTTRWGLAWSFQQRNLESVSLTFTDTKKKVKNKPPMIFVLTSETLASSTRKLLNLLNELQMMFKETEAGSNMKAFSVKAHQNTWSHQRRKKREMERAIQKKERKEKESPATKRLKTDDNVANQERVSTDVIVNSDNLEATSAVAEQTSDNRQTVTNKVVLEMLVVIKEDSGGLKLEMSWLSGELGREAVHQVLQYIKNKWNMVT